MKKTYDLVIVDDHIIFRDALKFVLTQSKLINVSAEASGGEEFLDLINHCKPDLVLMDISIPAPDGIECTRLALKKYPDLKIIALSMFNDEINYFRMIEAGAKGFVTKDSGSDELMNSVFTVLNGGNYFPEQILCNIIRHYCHVQYNEDQSSNKEVKLSKRENEVLELICEGFSNVEAAKKLGIGRRTIEGHRSSLFKKTGAKNSVDLVLYARKHLIFDESKKI